MAVERAQCAQVVHDRQARVVTKPKIHEHDIRHFRERLRKSLGKIVSDAQFIPRSGKCPLDELGCARILGNEEDMQLDANCSRR